MPRNDETCLRQVGESSTIGAEKRKQEQGPMEQCAILFTRAYNAATTLERTYYDMSEGVLGLCCRTGPLRKAA
jgi:hypothetical protein